MRSSILTIAALVVAGGALGWRLLLPHRERYEQPAFELVAVHDGFELRRYAPTLEAQVTLPGEREAAIRQGFGVLAGYIFGKNRGGATVDMTTPVSAAPPQRVDMTTPVAAAPDEAGWTVSFTMPRAWTRDTLPVPDDPRIQIVDVPARTAAVRVFSGRATGSHLAEHERALAAALARDGVIAGPPTLAQFDPPWIPGPLRRNELQAPVLR